MPSDTIVEEKAQFSLLKLGEAEPERLLWLAVAKDHDSVGLSSFQAFNYEALLARPGNGLQGVDSQRKPPGMTKQLGSRRGRGWPFRNGRDANGSMFGFNRECLAKR